MAPTIIKLTPDVRLRELINFSKNLWRPSNEVDLVIDFAAPSFFTPFSMMFIIHQIENYKRQFPGANLRYENFGDLNWPSRMGFFDILGLSPMRSNFSADHPGSESRMLRLSQIFTLEFKRNIARDLTALNEAVDFEAGRLTRVLLQMGSGQIYDTIQYSLREVMRNVFEHSGARTIRYCAQYWPSSNYVELIVADDGMGIYDSLIGNKSFQNVSARDALHLACMPGVSGNAAALSNRANSNPWQNSGFGLYMLQRICRNSGDFTLLSSGRVLYMRDDKKDFSLPHMIGTMIRLHFRLDALWDLRRKLQQYTVEGKEVAETIRGAKVLEASLASQMLRRDFS